MKTNKPVEAYIRKHENWTQELDHLKKLALESGLKEDFKWSFPVYTFKEKNIIGLGAFKSYVGIWFFQGSLLKDTQGKLVNAQEGKTQAMRQWRFDGLAEIESNKGLIQSYISEAVENQKAGKEIKAKKGKPLNVPPELQEVLDKDSELKNSFGQLNLTKKREFAEHIELAKREATKTSRLEKIIPMIKAGIGLNDKYK